MGGIVLHGGDIAEMKTGEGKDLDVGSAGLPQRLRRPRRACRHRQRIPGRPRRRVDGSDSPFLGLSVGLNLRQLTPAQKRAAYNCDITYTTNAEVGFDYLRDNMVTRVEDRVCGR